MMFARNLKPGETVKVSAEDGGEVLHLSQACLLRPADAGRTYLKVVQGKEAFAACVLQKDRLECCSLDLFLSARQGLLLQLEGKSEVSLLGYFEPEADSAAEDELCCCCCCCCFRARQRGRQPGGLRGRARPHGRPRRQGRPRGGLGRRGRRHEE
ncbi:hypothetical protein ETH_00037095 [Eimeria tenella]|uniref:Nucleoplasmin-like domain-containing protein n=1 Tax=Eimeria tenella TaxID=5802 RepID=U6KTQ8_EIMTE|nr:hypothetical protein ETH_00037095 [Eimeria tenella]CDJ40318.1 hypothetical protein ETH_00037095 [Eimeria tenella]|eukprot:XP_013231071.1 hypothetical protein ETH_00037095 [Eimeria tenella]